MFGAKFSTDRAENQYTSYVRGLNGDRESRTSHKLRFESDTAQAKSACCQIINSFTSKHQLRVFIPLFTIRINTHRVIKSYRFISCCQIDTCSYLNHQARSMLHLKMCKSHQRKLDKLSILRKVAFARSKAQ